jgi:poly(3-hydroxyalkanoate) synthetase
VQALFLQLAPAKTKPIFDSADIIMHNWKMSAENVKEFLKNFYHENPSFVSYWFILIFKVG